MLKVFCLQENNVNTQALAQVYHVRLNHIIYFESRIKQSTTDKPKVKLDLF